LRRGRETVFSMAKVKVRDNRGQAKKREKLKKHGKQQKAGRVGTKLSPAVAPSQAGGIKKQKKSQAPPTQRQPKAHHRYAKEQRCLLLGEGDLEFAAMLAREWGECERLTATTLADETTLAEEALDNCETVKAFGGTVLFRVDATRLAQSEAVRRAKKGYDRIVFNFPCVGEATPARASIAENQELLRGIFASASPLLAKEGELHVTLWRGEPYDSWTIVALARLEGMRAKGCCPFDGTMYQSSAAAAQRASTYMFVKAPPKKADETESDKPAGKGHRLQTGQTYRDAWKQRHRKHRS